MVLLAGYDLMLATLVIIAGSQGVYRFAPTFLLWLVIYAMIGLKFAANLRALLPILRDNIPILAYPAIALLSATWSLETTHSLYSAFQLTVTYLAGFWIGWRYRPAGIALIIVLALSPLVALSLVNWATGAFGEVYAYAGGLLGIFSNKNTLGRMSLLLGLAALGLLIGGPSRLRRNALLLGVLAMASLALLLSKSATSAIFMLVASGLLVALTMRGYRASVRLVIVAGGVFGVLAGLVLMAFANLDPSGEVLDLFGKSSTLTGRTFLWDIAYQQIGAQPWLGVGYDAYWDSGVFPSADRIQQAYGDGLISFHNFILDIWVGMGVGGVVAISITLGTIAISVCRFYQSDRSSEAALPLAIFTAGIGVALFNPLLIAQHDNMIVLLIAFSVSARIEIERRVAPKTTGRARKARLPRGATGGEPQHRPPRIGSTARPSVSTGRDQITPP